MKPSQKDLVFLCDKKYNIYIMIYESNVVTVDFKFISTGLCRFLAGFGLHVGVIESNKNVNNLCY